MIEALAREAGRLRAAATDPSRLVPGCPAWDVDQLVRHVGTAYSNVVAIVGGRMDRHPNLADIDPPESAESFAWFEEQLAAVLDVLRRTDPATPVWTFGRDRTAAFWLRRMVHETVVHRADVEQANGATPTVEPDLAADGIAEVVEVFVPLLGKDPSDAVVELVATDVDRTWRAPVPDGGGPGGAVVTGSAGDVLLWAWGRSAPVELAGDAAVADRFRAL